MTTYDKIARNYDCGLSRPIDTQCVVRGEIPGKGQKMKLAEIGQRKFFVMVRLIYPGANNLF